MFLISVLAGVSAVQAVNIGVIGAGIGSISFLHYLQSELQSLNTTDIHINIDIYEQEPQIGGRIKSVSFQHKSMEIGAPYFYSDDVLLNELLNELSTHSATTTLKAKPLRHTARKYAIYDELTAHSVVSGLTHSPHLSNIFAYWNYGVIEYYKFISLLHKFRSKFASIYKLINTAPFTSWSAALQQIGLWNETQIDCHSYFYRHIIDDRNESMFSQQSVLLDHYLIALLRLTHHHNIVSSSNLNAFSCLHGLSKYLLSDHSLFIEQGNQRFVDNLWRKISNADDNVNLHLKHQVVSIRKVERDSNQNGNAYTLQWHQLNGQKIPRNPQPIESLTEYDFIVIATPLELAGLRLKGVSVTEYQQMMQAMPRNIEYIQSFITLIGDSANYKLNGEYFNLSHTDLDELDEVFMGNAQNIGVNCFNHIDVNHNDYGVHRIYSPHKLMSQHLKTIFSSDRSRVSGDTFPRKKDVKRFAIWSYPRCEYDSHHILAPIMFGEPLENVFYLNSVETLSTAMELSVLSAKNIATLIAAKLSA